MTTHMSNDSSSHEGVGELPADVVAALSVAVAQGMIIVQNDGRILGANETASAMLGHGDGDLVGRLIEDVIPGELNSGPQDLAAIVHETTSAINRPRSVVIARRKDGVSIPLEVISSVVPSRHTPYIILSLVDVSGRINRETAVAAETSEHAELDRVVADIALHFAGI